MRSNNSPKRSGTTESPTGGFFSRSSSSVKPFTRYSRSRSVAQRRNWVPRAERTR